MVAVAVRYPQNVDTGKCTIQCLTMIISVETVQIIQSAIGKPPGILHLRNMAGNCLVAHE